MDGLNTQLFNACVEHVESIFERHTWKNHVTSNACTTLVASLCFAYMENPSEEQIVEKMMELFTVQCRLNSHLRANREFYIGEYPAVICMSVLLCKAHDNLLDTLDPRSSLENQEGSLEKDSGIELTFNPDVVFDILKNITEMRGFKVYRFDAIHLFPCRRSNDGYMVGLAMEATATTKVYLQIFGYGGELLMIRKNQRWTSEARVN